MTTIVVTNQAGVAWRYFTEDIVQKLNQEKTITTTGV
jgi:histidinol phosphatase-like enzyme